MSATSNIEVRLRSVSIMRGGVGVWLNGKPASIAGKFSTSINVADA